ncbi:hypothetical protein LIA77_08992 [Sarocladium implicatum]|nr:hypothetical protein LIA77_08992 [Sarocladium implicatum]
MSQGHHQSPQSAASFSIDNQIAAITARLVEIERRLNTARDSPGRHESTTSSLCDAAAAPSLLVPAAQGMLKGWDSLADQVTQPSRETAVYDSLHEEEHEHNVMEFLSLRRDLSNAKTPPFGLWWAYTVEETLLWPILSFRGGVNDSLDIVMLGQSTLDSDSDSDDGSENDVMEGSSIGKHHTYGDSTAFNTSKIECRGLDDGSVVPKLIDDFLANVHAKYPFMQPQQLRAQAAHMVENGVGWDKTSCKVLLACALGAVSSPWYGTTAADYAVRKPSPDRLAVAKEYFTAGQKRLGALHSSASMEAAHCLFIAGLYHMCMLQPVAGWRLLNAASIAFRAYISKERAREQVGARRNSSRSMESRLYWSCFMAEREVACEFGMETTGLNVIAYSTSLPTPPIGYSNDSYGEQAQTMFHGDQDERSWYFFLTHIMLRKMEMRIDNYTQAKQREAYRRANDPPEAFYRSLYEANAEFDYQLTCYYSSLPPILQFPLDDLTPCSDELCQYLRWRVLSVRRDICQPSLFTLLHVDVSQWSRALVAGLISHANILLKTDIAFLWAAGSTHRDGNTWLTLRKGVRAGLTLVAAQKVKEQGRQELMGLEVPDGETFVRAAQALVKGLKYWAPESRDCASNLQMLQNLHPAFED